MSIQDVARDAGVSVATVSRVFNRPDKVTPATRERVNAVAREVGYIPNASARRLRTQRSRVLGVVLPTLLNPVFAECLGGIARAATLAGYAIAPIITDYRLDLEEGAAHHLLAGGVDGVILVVSNPSTSIVLHKLSAAGIPYVLAYNRHPAHPCVSVDSEGAVCDLVGALVRLGHRRIGMVSGQLAASDRAQQRWRGFAQGMKRAGLPQREVLEVPFVEAAVAQIETLLRGPQRPTALVCSNDLLAIRCIRAAHLASLSVPQDLSVIGFDGIALGQDLTPMLSTIVQPNAEIGRCCVDLLVASLSGAASLVSAGSITLTHVFREGESCASPGQAP